MNLSIMSLLVLLLFVGAELASGSGIFRSQFPKKIPPIDYTNGDPGDPLFLTPYIEKGDIAHAQELAKVGPLNGTSVLSYSGFLTVNKTFNSNMFMWYFPSETKGPKDPVVLWLQGGPGGSSLFGLLVENGPYGVDKDLKLFPRKFSWNSKYNLLYLDNPVGTGFSFADDAGYSRTETDVAENLFNALAQFFKLFPDLSDNELYLTGESYAGKYIPALANRIHSEKPPRKFYMRGVAIGDGFSDPPVMLPAYADFMFQTGLLDENQREYFRNKTNEAVKLINESRWTDAARVFDELLDNDFSPYPSFFTNCTGTVNYYNYLQTVSPADFEYYGKWLQLSDVRRSIHVGSLPYQEGGKVEQYLINDIMQSVKPELTNTMNYYRVLIYSGQLDVIVALPLTEAMLMTVPWKYQSEYFRVRRQIWKVNPADVEVAGYVRQVHDFYQVMIRGGGHILPYDQPERTWDMLDRFITGRPFN